jgi:hypothetical protein
VLSRTRLAGEKIKIGGFALNTLKKLKGDKLGFPYASNVLANAIGLGATALCKYPCNLAGAISFGSILTMMGIIFHKDNKNKANFKSKINSNYKLYVSHSN